ncbi:energy-coupling factor transporter ATPase [Peptococcaceae bacterium 1198_IL3148]
MANLTYYYGDTKQPILNDINLQIQPGEFVLLLGKSGSGKTTLLRALAGLVPEFYGGFIGGNVCYGGKNLQQWEKAKLAGEVGFIFQDPEQQLVMYNVEREVVFGLENIGVPAAHIKRRVMEVMQFLNIAHLRNRNTNELSGGQKQLVVLASILAMQPKVLLLDEPTSQLDPMAAEDFFNHLKRINQDLGITVIMAEQRLERCLHLADRVVVIDQGKLTNNAPPKDTLKQLKDTCLLPAMNRFFNLVGSDDMPLTINEGRKQLQALCPVNNGSCLTDQAITGISTTPLLTIKDISYGYNQQSQLAIRNLNLTVTAGEFVAVVGANGSGKSTLLKSICGLLYPLQGNIGLNGEVGYLSQNPNDYLFNDTVYDEVAFAFKVRGVRPTQAVDQMLERLGLSAVKDVNPRDLSSGQRQRVALAAVMVLEPKLLLLDEPTRGLDIITKRHLADYLCSLTKQGTAVIMVTHDIEFIAEYASRVVVMFAGEIIADGNKRQVLDNSLYYAPQLNKLFSNLCGGVITLQDAIDVFKGWQNGVGQTWI